MSSTEHHSSRHCECCQVLKSDIAMSSFLRYNTFASAGSDGTVSIWDHKLKKRLRQYPKYNSAVPSVSFNCDGTKLAVGVSYNWDDGEEGAKTAERPAVFIRTCGDEVKVGFFFTRFSS